MVLHVEARGQRIELLSKPHLGRSCAGGFCPGCLHSQPGDRQNDQHLIDRLGISHSLRTSGAQASIVSRNGIPDPVGGDLEMVRE